MAGMRSANKFLGGVSFGEKERAAAAWRMAVKAGTSLCERFTLGVQGGNERKKCRQG